MRKDFHRYTKEEDDFILKYFSPRHRNTRTKGGSSYNKVSAEAIAERLGPDITKNMVIARAYRLRGYRRPKSIIDAEKRPQPSMPKLRFLREVCECEIYQTCNECRGTDRDPSLWLRKVRK